MQRGLLLAKILLVIGFVLASGVTYIFVTQPDVLSVNSFETCVKAGYSTERYLTVPTSAISSCTTPLGWTFKVPDSIRQIDSFEKCMDVAYFVNMSSSIPGFATECMTPDARVFPNPKTLSKSGAPVPPTSASIPVQPVNNDTASAVYAPVASGWNTHIASSGKYSFQYPSNWRLLPSYSPKVIEIIDPNPGMPYNEKPSRGYGHFSFDVWQSAEFRNQQEMYPDVAEPEQISFHGMNATLRQSGGMGGGYYIAIEHGANTFLISLPDELNGKQAFLNPNPVDQKILDSFTILN